MGGVGEIRSYAQNLLALFKKKWKANEPLGKDGLGKLELMHLTGSQRSLSKEVRLLVSPLAQSDRSNFCCCCFFSLLCLAPGLWKGFHRQLELSPVVPHLPAPREQRPTRKQPPVAHSWPTMGRLLLSLPVALGDPGQGGKKNPRNRAHLRPSKEGSNSSNHSPTSDSTMQGQLTGWSLPSSFSAPPQPASPPSSTHHGKEGHLLSRRKPF